ncbi:MAG: phage portal protein, partial [Chloroflexi bacterium]|nr:phage portal protein [Chloroflexota bacterium]
SLRGVPEARISAAYGVPAIVAGLNIGLARSTYSNYEEARKAFAEQTLAPLWKSVASVIQNDLVPLFGNDCYVDFDLNQVRALQTSSDRRDQFTVQAYAGGILTLDQALGRLGEDPIGGTEGATRAAPKAGTGTPGAGAAGEGTPGAGEAGAGAAGEGTPPEAIAGGTEALKLTGGTIERKAGPATVGAAREKLTEGLEKKMQSYLRDEYGAIADHLAGDGA